MDIECSKTAFKVEDDQLLINGTVTPCEPTHWSFGQMAGLLKAPAAYLRTLPKGLVVDLMNHGLQNTDRETVKFMTVESEDGGANILQAITSPTYGRIWDADCVDAVKRMVERSGGRFFNPKAYVNNGQGFSGITGQTAPSGLYASDRDVFMFMIDGGSFLDAGPRAQLNRGFICWNSEVGAKTMGLMTFYHNGVCGNHFIWGASNVNTLLIRHVQSGPTRFDVEAMPALKAYIDAPAGPVESQLRKAQEMIIGKDNTEVVEFLDRNGKFSKGEIGNAINFAKAEEGDCRTLWQAIQGFTAYARGFDYVDARVDLEKRAGALMNLVA